MNHPWSVSGSARYKTAVTARSATTALELSLASACEALGIEAADALIAAAGRVRTGHYRTSAGFTQVGFEAFPVFCLVRILVAAVIHVLVAHGRLRFEDEVLPLLPGTPAQWPADVLEGVTVEHLLVHSHGLAAIPADRAPVDEQGWIDGAHLAALLRGAGRVSKAGRYYSYGVAGYSLLGLVIEGLCRQRLGEALFNILPLQRAMDERRASADACPICPASGRGLELPVQALHRVCALYLDSGVPSPIPGVIARRAFLPAVGMPGWSPTLLASCHAWRDYGHGWYGHNGTNGRCLAYLRVHPDNRRVIAIMARSTRNNMSLLPRLVLQQEYPELVTNELRLPRIDHTSMLGEHAHVCGVYTDGAQRMEILQEGGRLLFRLFGDRETRSEPAHESALYPAQDRIFYLAKPSGHTFFLQAIRERDDTEYLWDHDRLWMPVRL